MTSAVAELAFAKGRHLFHQGDMVRGAYSLSAGLVALERVDENGEMVIIRLLRPGALFPCADLFADGVHGTGARALSNVETCFIPLERLNASLSRPEVRNALLRHGCDEARQSENTIFRLCAGHLAERVLALLVELATDTPAAADGTRSLTLPLSWRDVAAMVGTSPEVLSRTLRRMADDGRLAFNGRYITLAPEPMADNRRVG
ncbi:MAG: Crp/Fnr family transcriptional regulator [Bacteroidales bacterium]